MGSGPGCRVGMQRCIGEEGLPCTVGLSDAGTHSPAVVMSCRPALGPYVVWVHLCLYFCVCVCACVVCVLCQYVIVFFSCWVFLCVRFPLCVSLLCICVCVPLYIPVCVSRCVCLTAAAVAVSGCCHPLPPWPASLCVCTFCGAGAHVCDRLPLLCESTAGLCCCELAAEPVLCSGLWASSSLGFPAPPRLPSLSCLSPSSSLWQC